MALYMATWTQRGPMRRVAYSVHPVQSIYPPVAHPLRVCCVNHACMQVCLGHNCNGCPPSPSVAAWPGHGYGLMYVYEYAWGQQMGGRRHGQVDLFFGFTWRRVDVVYVHACMNVHKIDPPNSIWQLSVCHPSLVLLLSVAFCTELNLLAAAASCCCCTCHIHSLYNISDDLI